jgi:hypothetical protein
MIDTMTIQRSFWGPATERDAYVALLRLLAEHDVKVKGFDLKRTNIFRGNITVVLEGEKDALAAYVGAFDSACQGFADPSQL